MKQLLFIILFPCLALAQYPGNAGQKITLGEQTTADGLVFRGVASIDTVRATSKITRANKQDTSAYILLDTVTNLLWHYKIGSNAWTQAGGSTFDTTTLNLVSRFAAKQNNITLTTAGTSGLATFNGSTLNIPNYTSGGGTVTSVAALTLGTSGTDLASTVANSTTTPVITLNVPNASATARGVVSVGTQTFKGFKTFSDSIQIRNIVISNGKSSNNSNLAIGFDALVNNTPTGGNNGTANTAIGYEAMKSNTTGFMNVALGYRALTSNTTSTYNMAVGMDAMFSNTSGSQNVALGRQSLYSNTTSSNNVAIGYASLGGSTGLGNTAVGSLTLYENTTGTQNTAIGYYAGWNGGTNANITGSNNTFIGNGAVNTASDVNNTITLGNSSIATIRAQVTTITGLSDIRDKTDILPLNYGMNFIDKLKPVSFVWDMRDGGKIGIPEIGFIAQDLQQAQIDTGINIPNLVSGVEEKLEASYGVLLPIIVKALQEANEKIKSLEQRLLILENK